MLYSCADWLAVDPTVLLDADLFDVRDEGASQRALAPSESESAHSPRGFDEPQRGGFSLASSIEEFNAMIDADMACGWGLDDTDNDEEEHDADVGGLHEQLGARFFASRGSGNVEYGWTPFRTGEFQFASSMTDVLLSFLFVGALWGCTNPLIKRGSAAELSYTRASNAPAEFLRQLLHWARNWRFIVPFALNQSGSVAYVYLLGSVEISNAVPICNSLTFVFTAITSRLLGEKPKRPMWTYAGMFLILLGVLICFNSKN